MRQTFEVPSAKPGKFIERERVALLKVSGVGPLVIQRLEEIGICCFEELREYDANEITAIVASSLGATCWKNSPQAKRAIDAAIQMADEFILQERS